MKHFLIPTAILLLILSGAQLVPAAQPYTMELAAASVALALALVIISFAVNREKRPAQSAAAEAIKPSAIALSAGDHHAEAQVVTLLAQFQEKGRLVDFLMNDITPYNDAQVGSVARSVHQGCRAALTEHFQIEPMTAEAEGSEMTVPADYAADEFRLVGNLRGDAPFKGKLVHKGWRVNSVKLPRVLKIAEKRLPALAPAQVELK